jgi:hypothetical protein
MAVSPLRILLDSTNITTLSVSRSGSRVPVLAQSQTTSFTSGFRRADLRASITKMEARSLKRLLLLDLILPTALL